MTPDMVRVAIVGCGAIAERFHAPALKAAAGHVPIEVRWLMDPNPERVSKLRDLLPGASPCASLEEVGEDVDLALVASPVAFHDVQTRALLERGCHVLCEKPMATTVAECESMLAAAERAKRLLAVGLLRRFFPALQAIRDMVAYETFGKVRSFRLTEGSRFQWVARSDSLFRKETAGGGVLIDIGVHVLDLVQWWFGVPDEVRCADDAMGGVEANCRIELGFPDGVRGEVRLSRDWNLTNRYVIEFERASVAWDVGQPIALDVCMSGALGLQANVRRQSYPLRSPVLVSEAPEKFNHAFIHQIFNVVNAIAGREALRAPGEEAIKSIRLIERCYAEAVLMDMPWLTESESVRARALR